MNSAQIKVAIVEDSREEREALVAVLNESQRFSCVAAFENAETALERIPALRPRVLLMDINLPGISGTECVRRLRTLVPDTRIMMLTVFEDHDRIFQSLRAGADSYLLKKTPAGNLLEAIEELHQGGAPMSGPIARQVVDAFHRCASAADELSSLSPRELEVSRLLADGLLYKEIADKLGLGLGTIRTYIGRIYQKLHVRSRSQAILKVISREPQRRD